MVDWYSKGQASYLSPNFHMAFYMDMNGYPEANYDSQDIEGEGETGDPFMAFSIDTQTWNYGEQQVEIGLLGSRRIKINSSGVYIWDGDSWEDILALGGATNLDELGDVVIDGTPADNELLTWDTSSSKWINQTAGEAGLATAGHGHGQLHDESHSLASHSTEAHSELTDYNAETDIKHLTDAQLGALHAIYTLESHNNTYHSTNYHTESDGTGAVTVHSGITDAGSGVIISTGERNALHSDVIVSVANVEAVITAELVEGQSIDNRIDTLISAIDHDAVKILTKEFTEGGGDLADADIMVYRTATGKWELEIKPAPAGGGDPYHPAGDVYGSGTGWTRTYNYWQILHSDASGDYACADFVAPKTGTFKCTVIHQSDTATRTDAGVLYCGAIANAEIFSFSLFNGTGLSLINTSANYIYHTSTTSFSLTEGDYVFFRWYKNANAGTGNLRIYSVKLEEV